MAKGSQDRNANSRDLESATEADSTEGCCLWKGVAYQLAPLPHLLLPSYSVQDHYARAGHHSELGPSSSITNQENSSQACPD